MRAGKFSGFHSFTQEDALVVLSAGPIKDRSKEGRGLLDRFQYLPWKVLSCALKSNFFETFEGSTRTLSAHPLGRHLRQIVAIGSRRSTKQCGHRLDVFRPPAHATLAEALVHARQIVVHPWRCEGLGRLVPSIGVLRRREWAAAKLRPAPPRRPGTSGAPGRRGHRLSRVAAFRQRNCAPSATSRASTPSQPIAPSDVA